MKPTKLEPHEIETRLAELNARGPLEWKLDGNGIPPSIWAARSGG